MTLSKIFTHPRATSEGETWRVDLEEFLSNKPPENLAVALNRYLEPEKARLFAGNFFLTRQSNTI